MADQIARVELSDNVPFVAGSDTSAAAAGSISDQLHGMEALVYRAVLLAATRGLTDDEIEVQTKLAHQTASARRRALVLKGKVADSGQRRATRSGRQAVVWIIGTQDDPSRPVRVVSRGVSDGQSVAIARRRALEQAVAVCSARSAAHIHFPDKAEAEACAAAIRQLLND